MRRIVFIVVLVALMSVPAPAHAAAGWVRPVPGRVVRPFEPPKTKYGPGHLGVDFAAAPQTYVRVAGAGTVVFAGAVADTFHVVIRHANGWRTSYSFLATIGVRNGATVDAGQVIATTGGTGEGHDGSVLHLGLRIGDEYVDPMRLFGDVDLAALVHLAPVGNDRGDERPALVVGLTPPSDDPVMCASPRGGWCRTGQFRPARIEARPLHWDRSGRPSGANQATIRTPVDPRGGAGDDVSFGARAGGRREPREARPWPS